MSAVLGRYALDWSGVCVGPAFDCLTAESLTAPVRRVQVIEDGVRLGDHLVVAASLFAHAAKQGLETFRVRHRNAARVEEMHRGADRGDRRIGVEAEARGEPFAR